MKFYQEITLINGDKPLYEVWSVFYKQLHLALATLKNQHGIERIGVSFPQYKYEEVTGDKTGKIKTFATLGGKLRIFTTEETDLLLLDLFKWVNSFEPYKLRDYLHIKSIQPVPIETGYVTVRRYRPKDIEQVISDFAQFKNISLDEARVHCEQHKQPIRNYPFITLKSETNQMNYRLSIWQEKADAPMTGNFTVYGINTMTHNVTVPNWD